MNTVQNTPIGVSKVVPTHNRPAAIGVVGKLQEFSYEFSTGCLSVPQREEISREMEPLPLFTSTHSGINNVQQQSRTT